MCWRLTSCALPLLQPQPSAGGEPVEQQGREAALALNKAIQQQSSAEELDALLRPRLAELDPIHLCTAAARLVALSSKQRAQPSGPRPTAAAPPSLLAALAGAAAPQLGEFSGRQLASLTWALARLGWDGPRGPLERLLISVELAAVEALGGGGISRPTEVSLLAWSFARLGYAPDTFLATLEALPDSARSLLATLRPQEVSNLAWALAKLRRSGSPLLLPLAQRAVEVVRSCSRQVGRQQLPACPASPTSRAHRAGCRTGNWRHAFRSALIWGWCGV